MVCVAVTRGGWGDAWLFGSRTEAWLHPIVQYGDALLTGPQAVCDEYSWLEWGSLLALAGKSRQGRDWRESRTTIQRRLMEAEAPEIFELLARRAERPPTDPAEICRVVTQDRRLWNMAKKKDTAPAEVAAAAPARANGGGNLPPAVKGPRGVPGDARISMGTDKSGNRYGPDNNPKKDGSKTHGRFAGYVEGMTITEALATGLTTADLNFDRAHGFISWSGGTAPPTPAEATSAAAAEAEQDVGEEDDSGSAVTETLHTEHPHHGHHGD